MADLLQVDVHQVGVPYPLEEALGAGLVQVDPQWTVDRLDFLRVQVVQEDSVEPLAFLPGRHPGRPGAGSDGPSG